LARKEIGSRVGPWFGITRGPGKAQQTLLKCAGIWTWALLPVFGSWFNLGLGPLEGLTTVTNLGKF